jgi:hypothetical protein
MRRKGDQKLFATPGMIDGAMQVITSKQSVFYAAEYPDINKDRLGRLSWTFPKIMRIWPSLRVNNQVEASDHCPSHLS